MFRFLLPAAALLATLAMAARTEPHTADPGATMTWTFSREGNLAKLAFGVPDSDHLAVMLTCAPGGTVSVYGPVRPDSPALLQARTVKAPIDPLSGELLANARMPRDDRALAQLTSGAGLPVVNELDERSLIPADGAGRRLARTFLAHCASART
jgi:hypothetical protein